MKLKLSTLSLALMTLAVASSAQAIELKGSVTADVVMDAGAKGMVSQPVKLMKINLSKEELRVLNGARRTAATRKTVRDDALPPQADVTAIDTVLNQGQHGSCVTFAITGALDALIGKGDYVSQLCSLELGEYLEKRAYHYSGWDGSFGPLVLNQFMLNGIVSMEKQKTMGCAGFKTYPVFNPGNTGKAMSLDEYHGISEQITFNPKSPTYFYWEAMLGDDQAEFKEYDADKVLNEVKKNLATKTPNRDVRVTLGTIIPARMCRVGACATYQKANDTWALTKSMEREFENWELAGHEMLITGYDDTAVVTDSEGGSHTGLIKLRNSWGSMAGNKGDYYMTYDFFKRFVMEVQRVVKVTRTS